jgi:phasin
MMGGTLLGSIVWGRSTHHGGSTTQIELRLIQFRLKGRIPVNEADTKEKNTNPKAGTSEKRGLDLPFFTAPGILGGKMKAASGAITDVLREAYSTNARGVADYTTKVIEISGANTTSAFDFLTHLMGTKSLSEMLQVSATYSRQNLEATSAQNRELWELARKVATETAEPIKKSFASVLQKAA